MKDNNDSKNDISTLQYNSYKIRNNFSPSLNLGLLTQNK